MRGALPIMSITKNIHITSIILNEERPIMSLKLVTKKRYLSSIFLLRVVLEFLAGTIMQIYV